MASDKIIGIDLGTTNSIVAVMERGEPKVLANRQGNRIIPSVVGFTDNGELLVGELARRQQVMNPINTISSIKRFMGRRHNEMDVESKRVPYSLVGGPGGLIRARICTNYSYSYTPQEISAIILQDLKRTAEDYLEEEVTRAVITVPAYFNDSQRTATKEAGEIAGLTVERIINEPTAAALAYGMGGKKNEKVAVLHFGGGTFDISILDTGDGVFEVLATNGDGRLGGDDLDDALISYLIEEFQKTEGVDLRGDPVAFQRLREACEKAKCELSTAMESGINLPFVSATADGAKHLTTTITRAELEQLGSGIFDRLAGPCIQALSDSKLTVSDIDEVVLVGGSTRIPRVREVAKQSFGREPNLSINPDEAVAIGAAIQGAILTGEVEEQVVLLDVTPLSLGLETLGGVMTRLIERNTTIPTEKREICTTACDGQAEVTISVLQGEREFASDNQLLGRLNPMDISPAPRNAPKIEVIFSIDANGILSVSAKDMATGREQSIEIKGASGLSKTEIERMKKNAEIHAEYDRKHSELSDLKNQGDALVFQVDKILADQSDGGAEEELGVLRDAIIANEGEVRLATQSLEQTLSKIQSLEQIRCDMNSGQDVGNTMFRYVRKMLDWLGFRHGRNNESHGGD